MHRKVKSEIPKLQLDSVLAQSKNLSPRFRLKLVPLTTRSSSKPITSISQFTSRSKLQQKMNFFPRMPKRAEPCFIESQVKEYKIRHHTYEPTPIVPFCYKPKPFNEHKYKDVFQKRSRQYIRQILMRAVGKIQRMGMDVGQLMELNAFSKRPYEKPNSQQFIHCVKLNQLDKAQLFLEQNRFLVFDFDFFNMTALHWASKKGLYEMCELLVKYHSDVDALDIMNRSPLYLAIYSNQIEIVDLLLRNHANPWSTSVTDLGEVTKNAVPQIRRLLTQTRRIDIVCTWKDKKI